MPGVYVSESEGANFWLSVLTDLQNRGVKDMLIACIDNLNGFEQAINGIFPQTEVQRELCSSSNTEFTEVRSFKRSENIFIRA